MGFFKKTEDKKYESIPLDSIKAPEPKKETILEEDWVWIEGYKATDKDMKCKGYQFELGKMFTHEGELIGCKSGFHFCPELNDCFDYYKIGDGNRYFKVRALINLHQKYDFASPGYFFYSSSGFMRDTDKRVAKQIEFLEEVPCDGILKTAYPAEYPTMSEKLKLNIIQHGIEKAYRIQSIEELKETNIYSQELIDIIINHDRVKMAYALAKENISQDTRLMILFK